MQTAPSQPQAPAEKPHPDIVAGRPLNAQKVALRHALTYGYVHGQESGAL